MHRALRVVWETMLELPPKDIQSIDCPLGLTDYDLVQQLQDVRMQAFRQDMQQVQNKAVLDKKLTSMTYAVRICAAFPGLNRLAKRDGIALRDNSITLCSLAVPQPLPLKSSRSEGSQSKPHRRNFGNGCGPSTSCLKIFTLPRKTIRTLTGMFSLPSSIL